ncbi:putative ABC transport system permease protein [Clostridium amylolyticum]|uniref:Putative ABC transport system permease protein n=1 Tax=Clostridium amylolyticum TaxID=1121298 RepID=A0A1M6H8Q0_9CLOT|nr:FtsX-like permease family protein [Clostridium amylolyticum]SHJ18567.1 putative ABC transport system permease protein [Clostridium amylolyticum]
MYILKNAAKNLLRNKGRNIIIAVIILAMLTATAVSMIINTTTSAIIEDYKNRFGSEVYIQTDVEKFKEMSQGKGEMAVVPEIIDEQKLLFAESEYLKETRFTVAYPAYGEKLKGLDQDKNSSSGTIGYNPDENSEYYDANVQVIGNSSFQSLQDFKEGLRKITQGELYKNKYECIVSEDFAKLNNLKVGDEIEVRSTVKRDSFAPMKLKITGIYFDITESKFGDWVSAATNPRNEILTSYETMLDYKENTANRKQIFSVSATYYLKNPDMLEAFNKEAHQKGLHDVFVMQTDEGTYNQIVKPVEGLSKTSIVFMTVVLIFGSVILVLLSVLAIRERKYEIGVLRTMGMKKAKVVRGILYESLITIGICLVIGLSIGTVAAQPVSDMLLDNQIEMLQEYNENNPYGDTNTTLSKIDVSLSPKAVASVSAIAVALAIVSSSVGILYITRYEPMKILSERN